MTNVKSELGAQSFCFRRFKDNRVVIEQLQECGLNRIELCKVHADFTDESCFDSVIETYRNGGVEIVSIGMVTLKGEAATEEKYCEFAKRAGCRFLCVNFGISTAPEAFRIAEKLAEKYDLRLAIHNHGGKHWLGNSETLRNVFQNTSERIGLCLDTACAMDAGEDAIKMAEEFGERLYGVHIKDFVFDRARTPSDVVVGSGNLDLPQFLSTLEQVNFNGYAVLEYKGDGENPVPVLQKCVEAVHAA